MSASYIDFIVTGDPVTARATAEQALVSRKFEVTWQDQWAGTAERGSKVANVLVGALAQHFKVGVRIMSAEAGETAVRIERQSKGYAGGVIGVARTNKNMAALRVELEGIFAGAGVLRGVKEG